MAIAVFAIVYLQSILAFGLLGGLTIGWLPAAVMAWLGANLCLGAATAISAG